MLMTARQIADYTQLNVRTIYRKADSGEIPCYRIGTAIRFKREEVEQAIKGGNYAKKGKTECRSTSAY